MKGGDHVRGETLELLEHALGGAHGPHDELRRAAGDVPLEPLGEQRGRTERRAGRERRLVHPAARDERRRSAAGAGRVLVEPEVHERAEMVAGHRAPGRGGERAGLLYADAELVRRDERRDPAVAEAAGAAHRGLTAAADPERQRRLDRLGQDRDAVELPELAVVAHLVLAPAPAHDQDRLVGPATALLEGYARRPELALLLDADPDGGERPAAREIIQHRVAMLD